MRFRSVCKHFSFLTREPSFVDMHHSKAHSRSNGGCLIISIMTALLNSSSDQRCLFSADYQGGSARLLLALPRELANYNTLASVNGLLLLFPWHHTQECSLFVFNPSTREVIKLPILAFGTRKASSLYHMNFTLGYDPSSKQYKVLVICAVVKVGRVTPREDIIVYILTLGTNVWRRLDNVVLRPYKIVSTCSCPINGFIYLQARARLADPLFTKRVNELIVSFDAGEEKFRTVQLPSTPTSMYHLFEGLDGHLALRKYTQPDDVEEYWILEDYRKEEWTEVVLENIPKRQNWEKPFPVSSIQTPRGNTGLLLSASCYPWRQSMRVDYYDMKQKVCRQADITGLTDARYIYLYPKAKGRGYCEFEIVSHVETLFIPRWTSCRR